MGQPWGINLTAKCCLGQAHVPGRDLKPLILTTPTVCKHQNLEQGRDLGWSPRDRPPGSEHTQGSALHQERLRQEGPLSGFPCWTDHHRSLPRHLEVTATDGRGPSPTHWAQWGLLRPQGAVTATREHQGSTEGQTAGSGWRLWVQTLLFLPRLLGSHHSSVSWAQRRPWGHGAVGAERPCGEPRSASALEGGLGDVRFPADASGTCPPGASAGCAPGAPFTPP